METRFKLPFVNILLILIIRFSILSRRFHKIQGDTPFSFHQSEESASNHQHRQFLIRPSH